MAFWRDLGALQQDVSVVVMSEFGRRLRSNSAGGTDHGRGNVMMVLGPQAKGGRMVGRWPGLANEALEEGADLAVVTDYRTVLAEVLTGEEPPYATLMYVWCNKREPGTVIHSPRTDRIRKIVLADIDWKGIFWEPFIFVGLIFFVVCFSMSRYSMYLERKLKTDHR